MSPTRHTFELIGFDELRMAELAEPGMSTIAQDPARVGLEAARLLLARLDGSEQPQQRVVLPTALVRRGSGEIAPPA